MLKAGMLCLALLLTGCATPTGLIPAMSGELKKSNKDIDSAWREWKAPYVKTEDNSRLNRPDGEYIPVKLGYPNVIDDIDHTTNTIISGLTDYCESHGGTSTLATCTPRNLNMQCISDNGARIPSPSWLNPNISVDYYAPSNYFICRRGKETLLEVGVGRGTFHGSGLFVRTDSPQQRAKDHALNANDMDDYHLLRNPAGMEYRRLYELISRFEKKDDPENLLPMAKEQLNQLSRKNLALNNASKAAEAAAAAKASQMKRKNFLETVNVGSLVCRTVDASVDIPTGIFVQGQPQTRTAKGISRIAGYVNQRLNHKLQIQISAIHFRWLDDNFNSHEQELNSLDHYQGSSAIRINGSIWDNENDWEFCE